MMGTLPPRALHAAPRALHIPPRALPWAIHRRPFGALLLVAVVVVIGVPLAGKWARRHREPVCAFDARKIEPIYQARVVDRAGRTHHFCCVGCARRWLATRGDQPETVFVTDEASGREIDLPSAHLVRSSVVTNPITGDRTHAFARRADAEAHARAFAGWLLTDSERPTWAPAGSGY
jgi:hypothetical protein